MIHLKEDGGSGKVGQGEKFYRNYEIKPYFKKSVLEKAARHHGTSRD